MFVLSSPFNICSFRHSVKFKGSLGREDFMRGIDITAPPTLPKHFAVRKGCRDDIEAGSNSDDSDAESDEHNADMLGADGDKVCSD